ncbi:MAG: arsenic efflux protein [Planctomycetes bacterium]|nr:arsenic efflux protein [Planctomycetota bacterium]
MLPEIFGILGHALMITSFVFVMMLVVEYLNVLTQGEWQRKLTRQKWGQYFLAGLLGATPGCLGAFVVVAMYSHGVLTLGAVVTAMIATSGDEAFVMLALIPRQAMLLFAILFVIALVAGALTDFVRGSEESSRKRVVGAMDIHEPSVCHCFPRGKIFDQWRECSAPRGILATVLGIFVLAVTLGWVGPEVWNWIRVTILLVSLIALFIVSTVPDHFLDEHLWEHVARKHVPRIFLWTFGALIVMYVITEHLHLEQAIQQGSWAVLVIACLVGLIPESGPHLVLVTLYADGNIPLSILLASSIVQDGHGMLPVLAHSRHQFIVIKAINFLVGLTVGAMILALGF